MDLIKKEEIEGSESGCNEFPYALLQRMRPEVLVDASDAYAQLVAEYPDYQIGMVADSANLKLKVYWNRVA